jgi:HEAT repeat protein
LVQVSALRSLAKIGNRGAIDEVYDLAVGAPELQVRAAAAEALALLGDRRGVRLIGRIVSDPDTRFRGATGRWALKLLVQVGGQEALPDLIAAQASAGLVDRWRLNRIIRRLRDKSL